MIPKNIEGIFKFSFILFMLYSTYTLMTIGNNFDESTGNEKTNDNNENCSSNDVSHIYPILSINEVVEEEKIIESLEDDEEEVEKSTYGSNEEENSSDISENESSSSSDSNFETNNTKFLESEQSRNTAEDSNITFLDGVDDEKQTYLINRDAELVIESIKNDMYMGRDFTMFIDKNNEILLNNTSDFVDFETIRSKTESSSNVLGNLEENINENPEVEEIAVVDNQNQSTYQVNHLQNSHIEKTSLENNTTENECEINSVGNTSDGTIFSCELDAKSFSILCLHSLLFILLCAGLYRYMCSLLN